MVKPDRIVSMASAFYESALLFAAVDLGIFGELARLGNADAQTIALTLGLDQRATRLLLDACVAVGLLQKEGVFYRNTEESEAFLVPGKTGDLSGAIRYNRDVYPLWGRLKEFAQTGQPVEKPEIHLGEDRERTRTFVLAMHARALAIGRAVVGELDLKGRKRLLDVGGGPATYALLLAQANPELKCTVIDLPEVIEIAQEIVTEAGLQERVKTLPGDYHSLPFPGDNDIVIFFGVLHQESPEDIVGLLKKAYYALSPGGVVYVMDMMTDRTHTQPRFSALFGVNMALTTKKGWVFADEELKDWLQTAGFTDCTVKPLPPPMPHFLARAVKG